MLRMDRNALNYLDKRRDNMRYVWLSKYGFYISSARVCALIAKIGSAA